jgi:glycosyltransferase involved in cell wall biosynthesis
VLTHQVRTRFFRSAYEAYALGTSRQVNRRFHALLGEINPDVVHHHNVSLLGYKILRKQGSYLNIYTAHDYWLICQRNTLMKKDNQICETASCKFCALSDGKPPQMWRYSAGFRNIFKEIDALIAPSDYLRNKITSKIRVKAFTIANFAPAAPNRILPSGFSNFLVYAGRLEEHKGIVSFANAYKEIANDIGLRLVIVGQGNSRREIEQLASDDHKPSLILALGWVDRSYLWSLMNDAYALVVPSIWPENAPLVALEALSVGTPVVGSNRGGLPEIISKLDAALVFAWDREADLRRAVHYCIDNNEDLRRQAQDVYRNYFSTDAYLRSYDEILEMAT